MFGSRFTASSGRVDACVSPAGDLHAGLWWNDGDAFRSRLFDAISLMFPSGEQFLITAVSDWLDASPHGPPPPPRLQQEAQRFVREEAAHRRAHRLYNDRLAAHAPAVRLEQRIAAAVQTMAARDLSTRIALAAGVEQLTAWLSFEVLRPRSAWLGQGTAPQMQLWRWHAREEIDHRHVALDILKASGVTHGRRVLGFLAVVFYLSCDVGVSLAAICVADLRAQRVGAGRLAREAATFAVRALPGLVRLAWGSLRYVAAARLR